MEAPVLRNLRKGVAILALLCVPSLVFAQGVTPTHEVGTATVNSELPVAAAISADNQAAPTAPSVYSFQMCFDGATWDRCTGTAADTELPLAAALADNTANPTVPGVAAFLMCYDGSTWDRCLGGLTDTDDGTIAGGQVPNLGLSLNYYYDGANWIRGRQDPCQSGNKIFVPISQTTGTQLFAGTASNRTYICSISVVSATAQNIALVSGTGTVCATSTGAMAGGITAATGWNFAANGGLVLGNGAATIAKSDTDADNICILMSSTGQLSGTLSYVVAPN
jgi:hypothetical protein